MEMRRAGLQDAELLARLNRDVQQLHVDAHPRLFKAVSDDETVTAWFADLLAKPDAHLLIGLGGAEPVGYIAGMVRRVSRESVSLRPGYRPGRSTVDPTGVPAAWPRRAFAEKGCSTNSVGSESRTSNSRSGHLTRAREIFIADRVFGAPPVDEPGMHPLPGQR
jgi:hypothetical protein